MSYTSQEFYQPFVRYFVILQVIVAIRTKLKLLGRTAHASQVAYPTETTDSGSALNKPRCWSEQAAMLECPIPYSLSSPLSSPFCTLQAGEILFQDTHKGAGTVFIRITLVKYFLPNGHLGPRDSFLGNPDLSIHEIQNRSVSILVTILAVFMDTS